MTFSMAFQDVWDSKRGIADAALLDPSLMPLEYLLRMAVKWPRRVVLDRQGNFLIGRWKARCQA